MAIELSETLAAAVESAGASVVRVEGRRRRSSGVVWADGVVVASSHALEAEGGFTVDVGDGVPLEAALAGRDVGSDLAVLKIPAGKAPPATTRGLEGLKVGHLVLMLARPGKTVRATSGIVSALGREPWRTRHGGEIERYLEADAPHQPGFSGGPLVGLDGGVLGINTTGLIRGTSLTVPAGTVNRVVGQLLVHGKVRRGYLGLSMQPIRLPEAVQQSTGEEVGLVVLGVEAGGPADKAGIGFGDTLLRLGPEHVKDLSDLEAFLREDHVGETVPAKVLSGGKVKDLSLTIGEKP
ncbi:MAG: S1C family serine protease [Myxococcaceae bacterium]